MNRTLTSLAIFAAATALVGCTATTPDATPEPAAVETAAPAADQIATLDDAALWAEAATTDLTPDDFAAGVDAIMDAVTDADLPAGVNNDVNSGLLSLQMAVYEDGVVTEAHVTELQDLVAQAVAG